MKSEEFNEMVLTENKVSLPEEVKAYLDSYPEAPELYVVCRETYLTNFNSPMQKTEDGLLRIYISPEDIQKLAENIKAHCKILFPYSKDTKDNFISILPVIEKYHSKTSTTEEREKRRAFIPSEGNSMSAGTYYSTNEIPGWADFSKMLIDAAF